MSALLLFATLAVAVLMWGPGGVEGVQGVDAARVVADGSQANKGVVGASAARPSRPALLRDVERQAPRPLDANRATSRWAERFVSMLGAVATVAFESRRDRSQRLRNIRPEDFEPVPPRVETRRPVSLDPDF